MDSTVREQLCELARAARILAAHGHEDMTLGHVALRDPNDAGIWMKRRGISLGEVQDEADFLLVDWDGAVLEGKGQRHGEWPIHTEVMLARPDVMVSLHSHPEFATLLSVGDAPMLKITQDGMRLGPGEIPTYMDTADLVTERQQGRGVASALGAAGILFMRNHGTSVFSGSIAKLALTGIFLERAARAFLRARAAGIALHVATPEDAGAVYGSLESEGFVSDNWDYLKRDLQRRETAGPGENR